MNWEQFKRAIKKGDSLAIGEIVKSPSFWDMEPSCVIKAAVMLRKIGLYDSALRIVDEVKARKIPLSERKQRVAQYLRADLLLDLEMYHEAISAYDDILSQTQDGVAYGNRGLAHWECGKFEAALNDYEKAIELDPKNAILLRGAGEMCIKLKRPKEATGYLLRAIKLNRNYSAFTALGIARRDSGDWVKAYRCFKAALAINPGDPVAAFGVKKIEEYYDEKDPESDPN